MRILTFWKKSNLPWHGECSLGFVVPRQNKSHWSSSFFASYTNLQKGKRKNLHKSLLFRKVCVLVHFLSTRKPKINRFLGLIAVGYLNSLPVSIFTMMSWEPLIKHYRKNIYLITCIALHICYMDFSSIFKNNLLYLIIFFLLVFFWLFELWRIFNVTLTSSSVHTAKKREDTLKKQWHAC